MSGVHFRWTVGIYLKKLTLLWIRQKDQPHYSTGWVKMPLRLYKHCMMMTKEMKKDDTELFTFLENRFRPTLYDLINIKLVLDFIKG